MRPPFRPNNAPAQAKAVGYIRQTFDSKMPAKQIDLAATKAEGFEWYLWSFFGDQVPNAAQFVNPLTLGCVTLTGGKGTANGQIATAAKTGAGKWVGKTFGGGAYFEANIAFTAGSVNTTDGWPSFWSMAIEHLAAGDEQWPGQAKGFDHFIEVDFFEYLVAADKGANWYGAGVHDRYGIYPDWTNDTLPYSSVTRQAPANIDWSQYHRVGCLWVPAGRENQGSLKFYVDDAQIGAAVTWDWFDPASKPPPGASRFGILDHQRLALILGAGTGQAMSVRSVRVWQR